MGGSNISSPQYNDFSEDSGYQRSQSGDNNDWNTSWADSQNKSQLTTSQSVHGDSWSGFDSETAGGYQQTSSSSNTHKKTPSNRKSMKVTGDNFESLDVKSKPAPVSTTKNKAEDDAWNLLND